MRRWTIVLVALVVAASASLVIGQRRLAFPHARHANLFPLCEACHSGITSGNVADSYPAAAQCAGCHDGTRERRVNWSGPTRERSNLSFSHVEHTRTSTAAGDPADCGACHGTDPNVRMAVDRANPAACTACHAHEADSHLAAGRDCAVCHVPLVDATALSVAQIRAFPRPEWHDQPGFPSDHQPRTGADATACATCHARQTCTRCHLNDQLPAIAALGLDDRTAEIAAELAPEYPEPESHRQPAWTWGHADEAKAGLDSCANCHTRDGCESCHNESIAAALPAALPGDPRGVQLDPEDLQVHRPGYSKWHATDAVTVGSCESCHSTAYCEQCHTAATAPEFHAPNFLARHAPEAYSSESDCASCHNAEVFCRACHTGVGMGSESRLNVAFHTANPFWLVGHGAAARQGMEACASCHAQSTCLQCHSTLGGWRINPHGPGFDAGRLRDANGVTCLLCHRATIGSG